MPRKSFWLVGVLAVCLLAWAPGQASADSSRHGDRHGHDHGRYSGDDDDRDEGRRYDRKQRYERGGGHGGGRHVEKHDRRNGIYKSVYDDGRCQYKYKAGPRGTKEVVRCRGGAGAYGAKHGYGPAYGAPNDWAVVLTGAVIGFLSNGGYVTAPHSAQQSAVVQVLERAPDGEAIAWDEPRDNARYRILPTQSYRESGGRYCREYLTTATVGGRTREVYGQACRQSDGAWEIIR